MTSKRIWDNVSPTVIWMADIRIREALMAITGITKWNDVKRRPHNLLEVEMARDVLFRMFKLITALELKLNLIELNHFGYQNQRHPRDVCISSSDWT